MPDLSLEDTPLIPLAQSPEFKRVQRRVLRVLAILVGLLVVAIITVELIFPPGSEIVFDQLDLQSKRGRVISLLMSLTIFLLARSVVLVIWGVVGFFLVRLLLRLSERYSWQRIIIVILGLGIPLSVMHLLGTLSVFQLLPAVSHGRYPGGFDPFRTDYYIQQTITNYFMYLLVSGFSLSLVYFGRYYERRQHAAELQIQLADARFQALKMQIRPHFLFNALNAIVALIRKGDAPQADQMLTKLGGLLGRALHSNNQHLIPLRDELDFVDGYLELEQLRFQDSLTIEVDVPEPAMSIDVPNFVLQPLVENAIRHGISQRETGGRIRIRAKVHDDRLRLSVDDNGPGFRDDFKLTEAGIGLTNTHERLRRLFPNDFSFDCRTSDLGGASVEFSIPTNTG